MKGLVKYLFFIIYLITSLQVEAQELEGKWIITGNHSFGGFPGIHLMEMDKDSLSHYNFDEFLTKTSLTVDGNKFKIDTLTYADFDFKTQDRVTISSERLEKPVDYVRLVPTQTSLSKEEIEQTKYNLNWRGQTFEVDFKNHPDSKIMHSYLEKIDDTYFLVIYRHGNRMTAVPVKEVTEDTISFYGFPGDSELVIGEAVK